jgi:hypothetical protein
MQQSAKFHMQISWLVKDCSDICKELFIVEKQREKMNKKVSKIPNKIKRSYLEDQMDLKLKLHKEMAKNCPFLFPQPSTSSTYWLPLKNLCQRIRRKSIQGLIFVDE